MPWLINAAQVDKFRKSQKSLIILDASFHMASTGRNAKQEYLEKHIVGAQFFDIAEFNDPHSSTPNSLIQDENSISEKLGKMGIRNDYKIIFYDNSELHSACRALWMLKVFGHNPHLLYILDGGFAAWEKYINKVESGNSTISPKTYHAKWNPQYYRTLAQMKESLKNPLEQVIDMRHAARFAGLPESRPGLRAGHIPGSISLPYTSLFDKNTGAFLSLDKIRQFLPTLAIHMNQPIISTCGSGITASILDFILDLLNHKNHAVYDGSWAEWGAENLYPGETSLEERPIETCLEELDPTNRKIL